MSFSSESDAIYTYLKNHANFSSLGIVGYDNLPLPEVKNQIYVYFEILNFSSFQVSHGGSVNMRRNLGALQATIMIPSEEGMKAAKTRADVIVNMFDGRYLPVSSMEGIQFEVPSLSKGRPKDGRYPLIVRCPFYRNEYK